MSRTPPPPRPALRKAPDGSVHPAAPRVPAARHDHGEPLAPAAPPSPPRRATPAPAAAGAGKPGKAGKSGKRGRDKAVAGSPAGPDGAGLVTLEVRLPKALRKRAKAKAQAHGYALEDAVRNLVEIWVEG